MITKTFSLVFYRFSVEWVSPVPHSFSDIRLIALLNHTSLFEPLFTGIFPFPLLWKLATRGVVPGADITLNRPITGTLLKIMAPSVVTITRKRDITWEFFLKNIRKDSLILLAPEGRMKRPNGLDKEGKPMTVRGGIADLLGLLDSGKMLLIYSGGLHHVHAPGQWFPRFFKTIQARVEILDIAEYKKNLLALNGPSFKAAVITDLESRRDRYCPNSI